MTRKNALGRAHSGAGISENLRRRRVLGITEQKVVERKKQLQPQDIREPASRRILRLLRATESTGGVNQSFLS